MPQVLTQTQNQRLEQQLRLSQQQLQFVKLLEMPIAEFEQRVKKELMDNSALEEGASDEEMGEKDTKTSDEIDANDTGIDLYGDSLESSADFSVYDENDLPVYVPGNAGEDTRDFIIGDAGSFIEYLESQMMNYDLSDDDERILKYLIGSLDNRGFIDRPLSTIVDELAFKEYLYVSEQDVERVLLILQSFDPAGIGARST